MQTAIILTLLAIGPAATAGEANPPAALHAVLAQSSQSEREIERRLQELERERERLQRERDRQREQAERERERTKQQADRARERAREQTDRGRQRDGNIQEVERITRTFRIGTSGELHLSNVAGDIVVTRGSGSEAHVEIIKTARAQTSEDAREFLKLVQIDVVERPTRAEITTRYPPGDELRRTNRRNINVSVAYHVTAPAGTRVRANSISGSVSAKDIRGDVVLKSISGAVKLASGGGACAAESISGDVEVIDSAFDGAMSASTASGAITLRRVKARRIGVNSISGNLVLDDAEGPAVDAKSVSGDVQLNGVLGRNSRYELGSHSGSLTVAVGGATGFEVQARSFSGSVRSDFQFTPKEPEPARGRFGRSVRGVVGDGGAVVSLSTFSGNISITKR